MTGRPSNLSKAQAQHEEAVTYFLAASAHVYEARARLHEACEAQTAEADEDPVVAARQAADAQMAREALNDAHERWHDWEDRWYAAYTRLRDLERR